MGYNVILTESTVVVPENEQVLQALKDLNKRDDLKTGGSWTGGGWTERWFAWMTPDYDKTVTSAQEVFEMLGFDCEKFDDASFKLAGYDNKTGAEAHFISAIAEYLPEGSSMYWIGEDYARFAVTIRDGKTLVSDVTYADA